MASDGFRAAPERMQTRDRLAGRVDTELTRNEQETGISFFGDSDQLQITTYSPTMTRSILRHSYAKIEWVFHVVPGERNERVYDLSLIGDAEGRGHIEGVCATLPLGALSIKGKPRNRNRPSRIVTTPEEIESLNEVFGNE